MIRFRKAYYIKLRTQVISSLVVTKGNVQQEPDIKKI